MAYTPLPRCSDCAPARPLRTNCAAWRQLSSPPSCAWRYRCALRDPLLRLHRCHDGSMATCSGDEFRDGIVARGHSAGVSSALLQFRAVSVDHTDALRDGRSASAALPTYQIVNDAI